MEKETTEFKALLRSLAAEAQAQAGEHLTVEQLADYHFKKLADEEAERTQDHLVMCRDCSSLLLDFAAFCAPGEDDISQPSRSESEPGPPPLVQSPLAAPNFFQRLRELIVPLRPSYALAALLLALSLSLAAWIISLKRENRVLLAQMTQGQSAREVEAAQEIAATQRQRDEAQARAAQLQAQADTTRRERDEWLKPQLNVPIVDLPLGGTRAAGDPRPAIKLAACATWFVLIIPTPPEPKYPHYVIEILNHQSGAPVVGEQRLPRKAESEFTLSLPCRSFPAGEYRFNVYGLGRNGKTRVSADVVTVRRKQQG